MFGPINKISVLRLVVVLLVVISHAVFYMNCSKLAQREICYDLLRSIKAFGSSK